MASHILKCTTCSTYTMHEQCRCGGKAVPNTPPKFSPEDKYAKYRREVKAPGRKERGII